MSGFEIDFHSFEKSMLVKCAVDTLSFSFAAGRVWRKDEMRSLNATSVIKVSN